MKATFGRRVVGLSVIAVLGLSALLIYKPVRGKQEARNPELMFFCAAGVKPPVEAAAKRFEKEYGVKVQLQYGGSGTLLSNIEVSKRGDLFLAADDTYLETAVVKGLVAEIVPIALMRPVIAVRKGNPKHISTLADLLGNDIGYALANPDAAAVGRVVRDVLSRSGEWERLKERCRVFKPTVTDIANDIKIGAVDAGILWDATVRQYPELEAVEVPAFQPEDRSISVGILKCALDPTGALKFARYLAARDRGQEDFRREGYRTVEGDVWEDTPELVLFSGGVNRLAIEETIKQFEKREGVRVTRVYNGCGILVSQIKAGQRLDAYLACDNPFMASVSNQMMEVEEVSATDMVILAQKGNPAGIRSLEDLSKPGLKVGVANEEQSALGARTKAMLAAAGLYEAIAKNVATRTPTADLLVNQMRTGALDAAVVYRANTAYVRDKLDIVSIGRPDAMAVQPIGINRQGKHQYLVRRLKNALLSADSRKQFEAMGFTWRGRGHD